MTLPGGEMSPMPYWGRFVPISVGLVFLFLVTWYVPLLNVAGMVGIPAILLVLFQERQEPPLQRWFPAIATVALIGMVDRLGGLMVLTIVLIAILQDREVRRKQNWGLVGFAGSIPLLLLSSMSLLVVFRYQDEIEEHVISFYSQILEQMSQSGFDTGQMQELLPGMVHSAVQMIPAGLALLGLFVGFGALICGMWWLGKRGLVATIEIPQFTVWVLPEKLVWPVIVGLALLVAGPGGWKVAGLNLLVVLTMLYSVQGIAIMFYGFEIRGTPGWARVLFIIVLTVMHVIGAAMMAILGLLETWIPFRSLMAKAAEEGKEEDL